MSIQRGNPISLLWNSSRAQVVLGVVLLLVLVVWLLPRPVEQVATIGGDGLWQADSAPGIREVVWQTPEEMAGIRNAGDPAEPFVTPHLTDNGATLYFSRGLPGGQTFEDSLPAPEMLDKNEHQSHEDGREAFEKVADLKSLEAVPIPEVVRRVTEATSMPERTERLVPTIPADVARSLPPERVLFIPPNRSHFRIDRSNGVLARRRWRSSRLSTRTFPTSPLALNPLWTRLRIQSPLPLGEPNPLKPRRRRRPSPRRRNRISRCGHDRSTSPPRKSPLQKNPDGPMNDGEAQPESVAVAGALPELRATGLKPSEAVRSSTDETLVAMATLPTDPLHRRRSRVPRESFDSTLNDALDNPESLVEGSVAEEEAVAATDADVSRAAEIPVSTDVPSQKELTGPSSVENRIIVGELSEISNDVPPSFSPIASRLNRTRARAMKVALAVDNIGLQALFTLRQGDTRKQHIKLLGGSDESEKAVNLGLDWLAKSEEENGSWDLQ